MATDIVQPFSIGLKSERVGEEQGVILHTITLTDNREGGGIWVEEYGSNEQAEAFLRGVKAAAATLGHLGIDFPPLPERHLVD